MDVNKLKEDAGKQKTVWLSYFKKNKSKLEKMDLQVHKLHDYHSSRIDCLACANCCKTLGPRMTDRDIERLSKELRMKSVDFMQKYLKKDEDGDMVFQSMPCPFLGTDNYCAVYESRPKACREYPHTDRKRFYQIYKLSVTNAETCPIVYGVLNDLVKL